MIFALHDSSSMQQESCGMQRDSCWVENEMRLVTYFSVVLYVIFYCGTVSVTSWVHLV